MEVHHLKAEPWKVTLADAGEDTLTGGLGKRVASDVIDQEVFRATFTMDDSQFER
jgi:glucose-1-phosphate cytidylyltransferase